LVYSIKNDANITYMKVYIIVSVILFSISSSFMSCESGNIDLDNAGDEPLEVIIDNVVYRMPSQTYKRISLDKGAHSITVKNSSGEVQIDSTFNVSEGGLLNVAKADYYIWTDLYGDPSLRDEKLDQDWKTIGDRDYYGEFYPVENNIYVEKRWDFGLNESFPENLLGWNLSNEKYLIKSKIFRTDDLVSTFQSLDKKKSAQTEKIAF